MGALEDELKHLIVEARTLEDVRPTALGLDSRSARELSIAIEKRCGARFATGDAQNEHIFQSLRSPAQYIERTLSPRSPLANT